MQDGGRESRNVVRLCVEMSQEDRIRWRENKPRHTRSRESYDRVSDRALRLVWDVLWNAAPSWARSSAVGEQCECACIALSYYPIYIHRYEI